MTSEQRHELRYQRRKAARAKAKSVKWADADNYEKVFTYGNLYRAYKKCRKNVAWKASVQRYISQAPLNVYDTWVKLMDGTYQSPSFFEFYIYERGKKRYIRSTIIGERVVQRCLCDNALVPVVGSTFIHDNGACMKKKGYDFAVKRLVCHLQRHIRKHGTGGYILIGDLKSFFDNIMHWAVLKLLRKEFSDLRVIGLSEDLIKQFDPDTPADKRKGLGLGSQISQLLAPAVASYIDHYVKEVLGIKGYGRYMDDFYLIHEDKEYLKYCKEQIAKKCEELGMTLNERKTHIIKLTHGFTFLKVRCYVTDTGKIIRKIHPTSITRERRKLKKFHAKYLEGKMTRRDVWNSLQSWRSHAERFSAHKTINNMEILYAQLFIQGGNPNEYTLHQSPQGRYGDCRGSAPRSRICVQAG